MTNRDELEAALVTARDFTRRIASDLSETVANRQFDPLFSPIAWHIGHIGWQEEVWIWRRAAGRPPAEPAFDALFDSFTSVKSERASQLPGLPAIWSYLSRVREQTLELLRTLEFDPKSPLLAGGYVFRFIANHERQHAELIGIVRLLAGAAVHRPPSVEPESVAREPVEGFVRIPGGEFWLGSDDDPDGWDNERRAHPVRVADFELARAPVTAGDWLAFIEAGGYEDARLWSDEGNAYRKRHALRAPLHWTRDALGCFFVRDLAGTAPLDPARPVSHVSHYEAEAFARFAQARLPTEPEWELAASWDRARAHKTRWPWGDGAPAADTANLGLYRLGPSRAGAHPDGVTPSGIHDLAGNVWEWLGATFEPYPDFQPQLYAGYSKPWFDGQHRVARGGSFMTQPEIARSTFRNWYLPEIRQVPLGLRLARTS